MSFGWPSSCNSSGLPATEAGGVGRELAKPVWEMDTARGFLAVFPYVFSLISTNGMEWADGKTAKRSSCPKKRFQR